MVVRQLLTTDQRWYCSERSPLILDSKSLSSSFSCVSFYFFYFSSLIALDWPYDNAWNCSRLLWRTLIFEFMASIFCFARYQRYLDSSKTLNVFSSYCLRQAMAWASSCESLSASLSLAVWLAMSLESSVILLQRIFSLSCDLFNARYNLSYSCLNLTKDWSPAS